MSMFLPEGSSPAGLVPAAPSVSDDDIALMQRVFAAASARPNAIPEQFMSYVLDWLQASNLNIPIGQVFGFSQFVVQTKMLNASYVAVTSLFSTDPPDGAFVLDGLPKGRYFCLYGGDLQILGGVGDQIFLDLYPNVISTGVGGTTISNASTIAEMPTSLKLNLSPSASDVVGATPSGFTLVDLLSESNNVRILARVLNNTSTSQLGNRWIAALKYANL